MSVPLGTSGRPVGARRTARAIRRTRLAPRGPLPGRTACRLLRTADNGRARRESARYGRLSVLADIDCGTRDNAPNVQQTASGRGTAIPRVR